MTIDADGLKAAVTGLVIDADADRLLAVATALHDAEVTDPDDVPEAISNEAVIRCAGWLRQSNVNYFDLGNRTQAANGMRASGGRALLAPYRARPGVIK